MAQIQNQKLSSIMTFFCAVLLCCPADTFAAPGAKAISPETVRFVLKAAGINAEIINTGDNYGITKGVLFEKPDGKLVFVGFPKEGIEPEKPFLLSIDGNDSLVTWTNGGGLVVVLGEADVYTLGLVGCILDAVGSMVDGIINCGAHAICILDSVFNGVGDILGCI